MSLNDCLSKEVSLLHAHIAAKHSTLTQPQPPNQPHTSVSVLRARRRRRSMSLISRITNLVSSRPAEHARKHFRVCFGGGAMSTLQTRCSKQHARNSSAPLTCTDRRDVEHVEDVVESTGQGGDVASQRGAQCSPQAAHSCVSTRGLFIGRAGSCGAPQAHFQRCRPASARISCRSSAASQQAPARHAGPAHAPSMMAVTVASAFSLPARRTAHSGVHRPAIWHVICPLDARKSRTSSSLPRPPRPPASESCVPRSAETEVVMRA